MKSLAVLALSMLFVSPGSAAADDRRHRFDGVWDTVLSCPNSNGALGFSFRFDSHVADSVLHGEQGARGAPGWLALDGRIADDGTANLYADGLVGAAAFAVGQRPAGTRYGYHLDVRFGETDGTGHRIEGRPCAVSFTRKPPA
jgi:hypothetical protein